MFLGKGNSMNTTSNVQHARLPRAQIILLALLGLLMAGTRSHHFGSAVHLPDASLVIFFASGFYLSRRVLFPLLLAEAALVDYLAITLGGTSDWCVSPAYVFLIPTYACMWFGGRWLASHCARNEVGWPTLIRLTISLMLASTAAFLISDGSFYLLSGRFHEFSWEQYSAGVERYYWSYLKVVYAYAAIMASLHVAMVTLARHSSGLRTFLAR